MIRIILVGAGGRMGRQIAELAEASAEYEIVARVDSGFTTGGGCFARLSEVDANAVKAEVLLDFSHFSALETVLAYSKANNLPVVIGVTGYSDAQRRAIHEAARTQAIFYAPNMSVGVYALRQAAQLLAKLLRGFEIELVETHHNKKLDAPSGTAVQILHDLENASGLKCDEKMTGVRPKGEIGVHALRGGTVAGIHEVTYFGMHESVSLKHTAESRQVFAGGALVACGFMRGKTAKGEIYTMDDCIGSRN